MSTTTTYPIRRMQMSEREAGERGCPAAFTPNAEGFCAGSLCMAWRWVGKEEPDTEPRGFCGLSPHFPSR